jgi:hypothetical protein
MNINSISVLLGCAGLLVGGIGIVAQGNSQQSADVGAVQSARAAWPPHALVAGVDFHDEMVKLLSMGPQPRRRTEVPQPQAQAVPPEGEANIRLIRTVRYPGSRRMLLVEIEFIDHNGQSYLRRYPVDSQAYASSDRREQFEADQPALETYGYSSRRSRRYGRSHYRRWW